MGLNLNLNINGAKRGLATPPVPTAFTSVFTVDTITGTLAWTDNSGGLATYEVYSNTNGAGDVLLTTTAAGATSYGDTACKQNASVVYKIRAKKGTVYSDYATASALVTPLCWKTNQSTRTNVVINSLIVAADKTVNIDWGDGTNANYTGTNTNITKTYDASAVNIFNIKISGDVNYITTFSHTNQSKSFGDLSNWCFDTWTNLIVFYIHNNEYTGNIENWNIGNCTVLENFYLYLNNFTGNIENWDISSCVAMKNFQIYTNYLSGDLSSWDLSGLVNLITFAISTNYFSNTPIPKSTKLTRYNISVNNVLAIHIDKILLEIANFYEENNTAVNCRFDFNGDEMGTPTLGDNNIDKLRIESYFTALSKTATFYINALELLVGSASGSYVDSNFTYESSIDEIEDLYAVTTYDDGFTDNLPIICFGHGFSGDADTITLAQMHEYAAMGFFVINIGMRGRNSADGNKDASGREIYDVYDAIVYARANVAITSPTKAAWSGFSGGGGNGMNLGCKFPDLCTVIVGHWSITDYGEDSETGWYQQNASYRTALSEQVGGTPSEVPNKYKARNSRRSLWQNYLGGKLYLYHGTSDTTVLPAQSQLLYDTFTDNNKSNAFLEIAPYTHSNYNGTTLIDFKDDVLNRGAWEVPLKSNMQVIGFLKTSRFEIRLGNMDDHVANLEYDVIAKTFKITPLTGEVSVTVIFGTTQTQTINVETIFDFN